MRLISPRGSSSNKENSIPGEEYVCNDPELKSIIDAAWVSQREKVFKKKRPSVKGKIEDGTLPSARATIHHELEEIDELEESLKYGDFEKTPLKEKCLNVPDETSLKAVIEPLSNENLR